MADNVQAFLDALAKSQANTDRMIAAIESQARPNELTMAGLSEAAQKRLVSPPKPQQYRIIRGRSSATEATFDMVVIASKAHPKGRVVRLEKYRHPKGIETHQAMGGRVPDGLQIRAAQSTGSEAGPDGEQRSITSGRSGYSLMYLQWRWEEFYQTDLRRLVGSALRAEECVDPKDIEKVPWLDSAIFSVEDPNVEEA